MRTKYKNRHDKNKTPSRIYKPCLTVSPHTYPLTQAEKSIPAFRSPQLAESRNAKT